MEITSPLWILWALALVAQNFAFTFVSRARNSGSLRRHMIASIFSNGIWFVQFAIIMDMVRQFTDLLKGGEGMGLAIYTGVFYTAFTMCGALLAHYWALRSEKGKSAVGASVKYAQIPVQEWAEVKEVLQALYSPRSQSQDPRDNVPDRWMER